MNKGKKYKTYWQCESNLIWGTKIKDYLITFETYKTSGGITKHTWKCTCADHRFRKRECKHIKEAKPMKCDYKEEGETLPPKDFACPKCGKRLIYSRMVAR